MMLHLIPKNLTILQKPDKVSQGYRVKFTGREEMETALYD